MNFIKKYLKLIFVDEPWLIAAIFAFVAFIIYTIIGWGEPGELRFMETIGTLALLVFIIRSLAIRTKQSSKAKELKFNKKWLRIILDPWMMIGVCAVVFLLIYTIKDWIDTSEFEFMKTLGTVGLFAFIIWSLADIARKKNQ